MLFRCFFCSCRCSAFAAAGEINVLVASETDSLAFAVGIFEVVSDSKRVRHTVFPLVPEQREPERVIIGIGIMSSSPVNSPITNSDFDEDEQNSGSKWRQHPIDSSPTSVTDIQHTQADARSTLSAAASSPGNKRKSAFLPYRPHATVLTNLQRGNTEATFCPTEITLSFHERAGQGEITEEQVAIELEQQLSKGSDINFKDSHGFTALHWASYYGQLAAVQILLKAGADVDVEAPEMVTPLLLAACGGHHEIVRLFLERGADSTHMDIEGNTALMYAAAGNHPHTCNELLARDPDMTTTNEHGETAYSLALANGATLAQAVLEQYLSTILAL